MRNRETPCGFRWWTYPHLGLISIAGPWLSAKYRSSSTAAATSSTRALLLEPFVAFAPFVASARASASADVIDSSYMNTGM